MLLINFCVLVTTLDLSQLQEAPKATQLGISINKSPQAGMKIFSGDNSNITSEIQSTSPSNYCNIKETSQLCHSQNSVSNADIIYRQNKSKTLDTNKRKGKNKKRKMDLAKITLHRMNQSAMKLILFAIFYFLCCNIVANGNHAAENHSFDEKIQKHPSRLLTRNKRDSHIGGSSEGM